jgi:hypothetical protein
METVSASALRASVIRSVLIRLRMRSSVHIRSPPAPQQNLRDQLPVDELGRQLGVVDHLVDSRLDARAVDPVSRSRDAFSAVKMRTHRRVPRVSA